MKCRMDCLLLLCFFFLFSFAIQTNSVKAEAAQRRRLKSSYAISEPGRKT